MKFALLFSLMLVFLRPTANVLRVKITQPSQNYIYLMDHFGERTRLVDSAILNQQGEYVFQLKNGIKPGLYTLKLGKDLKAQFYGGEEAELDVVINSKENIVLQTSLNAPIDSIQIIESEENKLFFQFLKRDKLIANQLGVLNELPNYFPEKDPFFSPIQKRYQALQKSYRLEIEKLLNQHSSLLAAHYIRALRFPFMPFNLPMNERLSYMKAHWFDEVDFMDTSLIATNLLTKKAWGYIQLYRDQSLNKSQQEPIFAMAADSIISRCLVSETMAVFMRNQLVKLFEMLSMEQAVQHLAERYSSIGSCTDHEGNALKKRLEGSRKLAVGNTAPEFSGTTLDGKFFSSSAISKEKVVFVFWASWCPHCQQEMPELKKKYLSQKNGSWEVVTVSLDSNEVELKQFVQKHSLPWPTLFDGKSWFGSIPETYHLYATPAFFVLDRNLKILGKGGSLEEVLEFLN